MSTKKPFKKSANKLGKHGISLDLNWDEPAAIEFGDATMHVIEHSMPSVPFTHRSEPGHMDAFFGRQEDASSEGGLRHLSVYSAPNADSGDYFRMATANYFWDAASSTNEVYAGIARGHFMDHEASHGFWGGPSWSLPAAYEQVLELAKTHLASSEAEITTRAADDTEPPTMSVSAFGRVEKYLRDRAKQLCRSDRLVNTPPLIEAMPGGGASLHWKTHEFEALLVFPADLESPMRFFADDFGDHSVKGSLGDDRSSNILRGLLQTIADV